ncbi:hypothetical protein GCM10029978_059040 [Actinoallomurus acanthiterrae]
MQANRHVYADLLGRRRFADAAVSALAEAGVRALFGMPAESLNALIDAVRRDGRIQLVGVRHEGAGALMAATYGKLTGVPGVCMGTAGPGATHLPLGVYEARADRAPLLALSGQVPVEHVGLDSFQEIDPVALMTGVTAYNRHIGSPRQLGVLYRALAEAGLRRAPAHVACSSDVFAASVGGSGFVPRAGRPSAGTTADKTTLTEAAELIAAPGTVVLVGAIPDRLAASIENLAERAGTPVLVLAEGHRYLGAVPGGRGVAILGSRADACADLLSRCARLVVVGPASASVDALAGGLPVIQIADGVEGAHPNPAGWLRLLGEPAAVLERLADLVERRADGELSAAVDELRGTAASGALWAALDGVLPHDATLAVECGDLVDGALSALPFRDRSMTSSYGLGVSGSAVPAAIGAWFARPGHPIVAVTTDRGIEDFAAELLTMRRYRVPVTVIAVEETGHADTRRLAAASGLTAYRVEDARRLGESVAAALDEDGPTLVAVPSVLSRPARVTAGRAATPTGAAAMTTAAETGPDPVAPTRPAGPDVRPTARPRTQPTGRETPDAAAAGTVGAALGALLAEIGVAAAYVRPCAEAASPAEVCRAAGITVNDVRHPESAAMTASAVAKHSGRPAVCVAAGDADVILQLNGVFDALFDHAAVVVLGSACRVVDGTELFAGIARTVRLDGSPGSWGRVSRALRALAREPGVVYVDVDPGALTIPVEDAGPTAIGAQPTVVLPAEADLDRAVDRLTAARRPVLLVGRGGRDASTEVTALAVALRAPVVTTMPGRGVVPDDHALFAGAVGSSGHQSATETLAMADVVLAFGISRRGASAFDLPGDYTLIQVDRDLGRARQRAPRRPGAGGCGAGDVAGAGGTDRRGVRAGPGAGGVRPRPPCAVPRHAAAHEPDPDPAWPPDPTVRAGTGDGRRTAGRAGHRGRRSHHSVDLPLSHRPAGVRLDQLVRDDGLRAARRGRARPAGGRATGRRRGRRRRGRGHAERTGRAPRPGPARGGRGLRQWQARRDQIRAGDHGLAGIRVGPAQRRSGRDRPRVRRGGRARHVHAGAPSRAAGGRPRPASLPHRRGVRRQRDTFAGPGPPGGDPGHRLPPRPGPRGPRRLRGGGPEDGPLTSGRIRS